MLKLELGKLMYLYENGQMPQRLIKLLTKTSNIHEHNTIQAINSGLFIRTINSELGKKTIKYRSSKLWNSIPHLLKEKHSMHLFKKGYHALLNRGQNQ